MANNIIGNLIYKITGDSSALDKSVKKSNTEVKGFGKSLGNIGSIIKGALFTGALLLGAKKVLDFGKQLISAASDAEETQNKFSVVFESVADDAEAAALRIKDEFKLSDETVQKFLSGVGDITSGLGATSKEALDAADKITRLGLDINSFANLSGGAEQAVSALTSLFTGEREAAKALGIVINDTNLKAYAEDMGKVFKELTPLEKGFLSLELATKQSQLAIGDFARSSDSYANTAKSAEEATKDFKAALGESLLPAATESLKIFTGLTKILTEFIKKRNELNNAEKASESGIATQKQKILLIDEELKGLNSTLEFYKKQSDSNRIAGETVKDLKDKTIDLITNLLREKDAIIQVSKAQQESADKQKIIDDQNAKVELTRLEAEELLSSRIKDRLTDEEKQLQYLQEQIDYWVQFRDIVGVQQLLNDLIAERNGILKESNASEEEGLRDVEDLKKTLEENRIARHEKELEDIGDKYEEEDRLRQEDLAKEKEAIAEKIQLALQYSEAAIGFLSALNSFATATAAAELQRLEESGASEEELAAKKKQIAIEEAKRKKALGILSAGIDTASAIIGFLANPGGIPGIALSILAGVTGAIQIGAIAATPIPSFANGGIIPGTPSKTDNTLAMVASGEEVLTMSDPRHRNNNGGSGGGNPIIINATIDKKVLFSVIYDGTKSGSLLLDKRSSVG